MNAELFAIIEHPGVSAQVNVVSGYSQFVRGLASLPEVQNLLGQIQSRDDTMRLLMRVLELVRAPYDPAYENPYDVALAAYLWVLSVNDSLLARVAAEWVQNCPGCWWSRKVAEKLVAQRAKMATPSITKVMTNQVPLGTKATHSANSGVVYFGFDLDPVETV